MPTPEPRTTPCDAAKRAGRLAKAKQFADAAATVIASREHSDQFTDAIITPYVHAGIAAADVVCCARLGKHARGESHDDAVRLLSQTSKPAAKSLSILLGMKTRSSYSGDASPRNDLVRAGRAVDALLKAASEAH